VDFYSGQWCVFTPALTLVVKSVPKNVGGIMEQNLHRSARTTTRVLNVIHRSKW
jgi:hypothetical protein